MKNIFKLLLIGLLALPFAACSGGGGGSTGGSGGGYVPPPPQAIPAALHVTIKSPSTDGTFYKLKRVGSALVVEDAAPTPTPSPTPPPTLDVLSRPGCAWIPDAYLQSNSPNFQTIGTSYVYAWIQYVNSNQAKVTPSNFQWSFSGAPMTPSNMASNNPAYIPSNDSATYLDPELQATALSTTGASWFTASVDFNGVPQTPITEQVSIYHYLGVGISGYFGDVTGLTFDANGVAQPDATQGADIWVDSTAIHFPYGAYYATDVNGISLPSAAMSTVIHGQALENVKVTSLPLDLTTWGLSANQRGQDQQLLLFVKTHDGRWVKFAPDMFSSSSGDNTITDFYGPYRVSNASGDFDI